MICLQKENEDWCFEKTLFSKTYFDFQVSSVVIGFLEDKNSESSSNEDLLSKIVANGKPLDEKIALG